MKLLPTTGLLFAGSHRILAVIFRKSAVFVALCSDISQMAKHSETPTEMLTHRNASEFRA
jgi:hypothetical protein